MNIHNSWLLRRSLRASKDLFIQLRYPWICFASKHKTENRDPLNMFQIVKLQNQSMNAKLRELLDVDMKNEFTEIPSEMLKNFIENHKYTYEIVDETTKPPLIKLSYDAHNVKPIDQNKRGSKDLPREKKIRIGHAIDQNMLNLRIKQIKEFIEAGHVVYVTIKLPRLPQKLKELKPSDKLSSEDNELMRVAKITMEEHRKKFTNIFQSLEKINIKITDQQNLEKITIVLMSSQQ